MRHVIALTTSLFLLAPAGSKAAELKQETVQAWDTYIETANARMAQRTGHITFLWVDETPERVRRVRGGEIVVSPVGEHNPKNVPHGLIHDWIGAAFIPETTINELLTVVRDYGHYKEFYKPTVIESKPVSRVGTDEDRFSMVMLNKSLFLKMALEGEYYSSFHQVEEKRWYSVARATRVQQIERYGQPDEHKLPVGEGNGYIWRLCSFTRYEERDGGVYVELEAIALSRNIPVEARLVAEPIVRRVSKSALVTSLKQTSEAVRSARQDRAGTQ